jgi:hypothetical protein
MGRVAIPNEQYLQKQRSVIMDTQRLSDKEMASRLGVTVRMWRMYRAGLVPIPQDLLYIRAMEDADVCAFGSNFLRHLWSL